MSRQGSAKMPDTPINLRVSQKNSTSFYIRAAVNFLRGTQDKPAVNTIDISALGGAIGIAATVATAIEAKGLGMITKVQTNYLDVPGNEGSHGSPQININIERTPTMGQ